ncbi:MAG: hypothetical protein IJ191_03680 [Treponema sp.]|nr:hypothetical protein [Treponema sp.]
MLYPRIKQLGKKLHFKRTDNKIVGTVKNSFVKICDGIGFKSLEITFAEDMQNDKKISEILVAHRVTAKICTWQHTMLTITFREIFLPYSLKKIVALMAALTDYAYEKNPTALIHCESCGLHSAVQLYTTGVAESLLCLDCYRRKQDELSYQREQDDAAGNHYLAGALGAVLFALPGVAVTALLFIFLDMVAAVSAVLYSALALKGYKVFKGRMTKRAAVIIPAVTVGMTVFGMWASYFVSVLKEIYSQYHTVAFRVALEVMLLPELQHELVKGIILALIVCSFFIFVNFFSLLREGSSNSIRPAREI